MEATRKRNIRSGNEWNYLFPTCENDTATIRKDANVHHTVEFIPKVVHSTLDQTKKISERLKASSTYETCRNIWHFVYGHINYKKDEDGFEQIRSPSRAWHDRKRGVDCDCYTVFISSILTNLKIPHRLRITKYHRDYFQHIYPVVPFNGRLITIDCVTDKFDYEVPFSEKKDYPMELQYLNGFDGDGMEDLGSLIKKAMAKSKTPLALKKKVVPASPPKPVTMQKPAKGGLLKNIKAKIAADPEKFKTVLKTAPLVTPPEPKQKKKGLLKKVLNVVNKVNPATLLLRNGLLAAMKLNIKNVAARLRWSYLSPAQAAAKGIDPARFQKLLATRQKLEKIFYGAGGKESNLKKAILGGKGNKDKAVNGLGMLPMHHWAGYMSEYTPLEQLLGPEIYYSENVEGMEGFQGFGQLGEPVTLASVGAAMGVIAGIVASLKQIGDIFKKKQPGSEDFDESKTDAPENSVDVPANTPTNIPSTATNPIVPLIPSGANMETEMPPANVSNSQSAMVKSSNDFPLTVDDSEANDSMVDETSFPTITNNNAQNLPSNTPPDNPTPEKETFWDKNKKWLKPVAIGVGGITLVAIGYKMLHKENALNKAPAKNHQLSGLPRKRKKGKKKTKQKHSKKKAVALL
jgi:hypothetical protein